MQRSASGEPARTPLTSTSSPNRTTCRGCASGSLPSRSSALSHVGSASRAVGSTNPPAPWLASGSHWGAGVAGVDDGVGGGPPHLGVGGGGELLHHGPREGAPDREVGVRRGPLLGFDDGEVLHVVAGDPAQVLAPTVQQLAEVQRIPRRPSVVVRGGFDRHGV